MIPVGIAKLLVIGSASVTIGVTGYQLTHPSPMTPRQQAIQHQKDWAENRKQMYKDGRAETKRATGPRRIPTTSQRVPSPRPSLVGRLWKAVPKPRVRLSPRRLLR